MSTTLTERMAKERQRTATKLMAAWIRTNPNAGIDAIERMAKHFTRIATLLSA
jgi:hypothetical protein